MFSDDDIKEIVSHVPKGCSFTFVSDSCHSGGLIDSAKEQIGESFKKKSSKMFKCLFGLFCSKGTTSEAESKEETPIKIDDDENDVNGRNRFLPLQTSIKMLKQATGRDDIKEGNIRTTLFDLFGEDASPKVRKFMKVILSNMQESTGEGLMLRSLAKQAIILLKDKLNDEEYLKPAMETQVKSKKEVYAGAINGGLGSNDDDFRDLVDMAPKDCPITIVSDSCHSGGLIDEAKEQIGESTKKKKKDSGESSRTNKETGVEETESKEITDLGSRSLPLDTLIDMLKQETGKDDIEVGKIRTTLFDMFGEDSSPKVKKFMNVILSNLQETTTGQTSQGDILESVANLTQEFLEQKINDVVIPAIQEVYAGAINGALPDNGILISGCQTDQTSADASPPGHPEQAYGALTNAIQIILKETNGKISNKDLVLKVRKLLRKQGFEQRPGLYCSDDYVNDQFIC
ncbi:unnamed protein product [Brassica rapa subsp. narinosa]|uniref:(rape) hypothetical protein n=1 Tax=Brassica napus TaxID=3708 RepID=A0A816ZHT6_BRANA|nr:unnamed protein product [Brassica napus]